MIDMNELRMAGVSEEDFRELAKHVGESVQSVDDEEKSQPSKRLIGQPQLEQQPPAVLGVQCVDGNVRPRKRRRADSKGFSETEPSATTNQPTPVRLSREGAEKGKGKASGFATDHDCELGEEHEAAGEKVLDHGLPDESIAFIVEILKEVPGTTDHKFPSDKDFKRYLRAKPEIRDVIDVKCNFKHSVLAELMSRLRKNMKDLEKKNAKFRKRREEDEGEPTNQEEQNPRRTLREELVNARKLPYWLLRWEKVKSRETPKQPEMFTKSQMSCVEDKRNTVVEDLKVTKSTLGAVIEKLKNENEKLKTENEIHELYGGIVYGYQLAATASDVKSDPIDSVLTM